LEKYSKLWGNFHLLAPLEVRWDNLLGILCAIVVFPSLWLQIVTIRKVMKWNERKREANVIQTFFIVGTQKIVHKYFAWRHPHNHLMNRCMNRRIIAFVMACYVAVRYLISINTVFSSTPMWMNGCRIHEWGNFAVLLSE